MNVETRIGCGLCVSREEPSERKVAARVAAFHEGHRPHPNVTEPCACTASRTLDQDGTYCLEFGRELAVDHARLVTGHNGHGSPSCLPRLHGSLAWQTPAERFDGTPLTDLGFEHVPSLAPVADLLAELLAA